MIRLILFVAAFGLVFFPVTDSDIFWHLAAGREMIRQGCLLRADPFSFAPTLAPWVNLHWLFQLIVYGVHSLAGLYGLITMKCLLFALAAVVCFGPARGGNPWLRLALAVFSLYQVRYLALERPVMFTLLFLVLFLALLERFRETGEYRFLLALLPLQILWVNLQGLSPIGPFLVSAYAAETAWQKGRIRPLARTAAALCGCLFLNPYGWQGALFPLKLLLRITPFADPLYSLAVAENLPLWRAAGHERALLFIVLFLAFLYAWLVFRDRQIRRPSWGMVLVAFLALSFMALRNTLLFVFVALFLTNRVLSEKQIGFTQNRIGRAATAFALAAVIVVPLLSQALLWPAYRGLGGLSPFRFGEGGARFLKQHPVNGPLFNADRFGGYLLWNNHPPLKVFMDGRFMLRPPEVFRDYVQALVQPERFDALCDAYHFTHVILPTAVFRLYEPLVSRLAKDPRWSLVFSDGACVVFTLNGAESTPRAAK